MWLSLMSRDEATIIVGSWRPDRDWCLFVMTVFAKESQKDIIESQSTGLESTWYLFESKELTIESILYG